MNTTEHPRPGSIPTPGEQVLAWARALAEHTDVPGELTVTYCRRAHQDTARQLVQWMLASGFDSAQIDAVGNVVGRYEAASDTSGAAAEGSGSAPPPALMTGSHFDTVRNGGRYDGRLGILAPMVAVRRLAAERRRLPFALEVVGFAEEEGVRFGSSFLGSSALTGGFDHGVLDSVDADGVPMRDAMRAAGLDPSTIASLARDPAQLLGFVEIHIEQGPVLLERDLALGVVSSINGGVRILIEIEGVAGHAGTTPMVGRRDAACAAADLILYLERRCLSESGLVGTVGTLEVPGGSINVIPGACGLSLDIRAPSDAQRDRAIADVMAELAAIAERRSVSWTSREVLRVAAAPSDPTLRGLWSTALERLGLPRFDLPSGAGHDAMKMAELCPQAMLFVRCGNGGISHNPLETMTGDDAQLAVDAFTELLNLLAARVRTDRAERGA